MSEKTNRRKERIRSTLERRQKDLTLILDNIHDPHNVSAILRSCDAFGVAKVYLYYTTEAFPKIGRKTSASAFKWVYTEKYSDAQSLFSKLKTQGIEIIGTGTNLNAIPIDKWDFTQPTAVVLGNEHRGISEEIATELKSEIYIPMQGMVKSFNVSVAAAIILYESWKQRSQKGMYQQRSLPQETFEKMFQEWCNK